MFLSISGLIAGLPAHAGEGVAVRRISDGEASQPTATVPVPSRVDGTGRPVRWADEYHSSPRGYPVYGDSYGGYGEGYCRSEYCNTGACASPGVPLRALAYCGCELCRRFPGNVHKGCNRSPDYGWSPPSEMVPVRVPISYQKYWPDYWIGQQPPASYQSVPPAPTIYMPTDTTQLGFYYNTVPAWQPNRAMLPPPPWPADWHCRNCPTYRANYFHSPPVGARHCGPAGKCRACATNGTQNNQSAQPSGPSAATPRPVRSARSNTAAIMHPVSFRGR